jgi:hypothetical protein
MKGSEHDEVPDELASVVNRLRAERADVGPLELDQIKQRALSQSTSRYGRRTYMKSRIAAILTVIGLMGGTGGAIAIASISGSSPGSGNGAASGQYCPQMRNCRPGHHHHHHHHHRHHHHHHHHHHHRS